MSIMMVVNKYITLVLCYLKRILNITTYNTTIDYHVCILLCYDNLIDDTC